MRDLRELNKWRDRSSDALVVAADERDLDDESKAGFFRFRHGGKEIRVYATSGLGWDHVSVSLADRCPSWEEMCWVKEKFFEPHETAMQLHVPAEDHVNNHRFALHLWRPNDGQHAIPRPPSIMVGMKSLGVLA